jgi:hypothetical protein
MARYIRPPSGQSDIAAVNPDNSALGASLVGPTGRVFHLSGCEMFGLTARMSDELLILGVRLAGGFHFVTLVLACFTPIPPDWEKNLATLPPIHRRFAVAQNFSIGATIAVLGLLSLLFAPTLVAGSPLARAVCGATALFWGGRLCVLPWLGVRPALTTPLLRFGYSLLLAECLIYAAAYGWLALRHL